MRYTTTDAPDEPLNGIQDGSLGDKMGIAASYGIVRSLLSTPGAFARKTYSFTEIWVVP